MDEESLDRHIEAVKQKEEAALKEIENEHAAVTGEYAARSEELTNTIAQFDQDIAAIASQAAALEATKNELPSPFLGVQEDADADEQIAAIDQQIMQLRQQAQALQLQQRQCMDALMSLDRQYKEIEAGLAQAYQETEQSAKEEWTKLEQYQFDDQNYYRIINQKGYDDFEETGNVRSSPDGTESYMVGKFDLGHRQTSFPSFSKGTPDLSYAKEGENNYILESDLPMYRRGDTNPVTGTVIRGRHWAYRPIHPETGRAFDLSAEHIKDVYKIDAEGGLYIKNKT